MPSVTSASRRIVVPHRMPIPRACQNRTATLNGRPDQPARRSPWTPPALRDAGHITYGWLVAVGGVLAGLGVMTPITKGCRPAKMMVAMPVPMTTATEEARPRRSTGCAGRPVGWQ